MARNHVVALENFQQFTAINVLNDPGHIGGPVVIPNGVKVILVWNLTNGKVGRNVLWANVPGGFAATASVAETVRAALVARSEFTALLGFLALTVSLAGVHLQDARSAGNPEIASTGAATAGTGTGLALPDEVALALTLRTARVGTQFRGRLYQPGYAAVALAAGGVASTATVTALSNYGTALNAVIGANVGTWSIAQPARAAYTGRTGTQHPARAAALVPITSWICRDNHWDSQRRRGLK
jgi:hypothetical protein